MLHPNQHWLALLRHLLGPVVVSAWFRGEKLAWENAHLFQPAQLLHISGLIESLSEEIPAIFSIFPDHFSGASTTAGVAFTGDRDILKGR